MRAFPGAPVDQQRTSFDSQLATVKLQQDLNNNLRLTVSGRYCHSSIPEYRSFVYPGLYPLDPATPTEYPILPLNMQTSTNEATFDANMLVKVNGLNGHHELLAGIDYDHTDFFSGMGFTSVPVSPLDLAQPASNLAFGAFTLLTLTQTDRYQTIAANVQEQATYWRLQMLAEAGNLAQRQGGPEARADRYLPVRHARRIPADARQHCYARPEQLALLDPSRPAARTRDGSCVGAGVIALRADELRLAAGAT